MTEAEQIRSQRLFFVSLSVCLLLLPVQVIGLIASEQQASMAWPLLIYLGFIAAVATTQTMLAQRLYAMHGLQRFVFDTYAWFMVAGMIACPLAAANLFGQWSLQVDPSATKEMMQSVRWYSGLVLYFMLFPVFFLTEFGVATAAWFVSHFSKASE